MPFLPETIPSWWSAGLSATRSTNSVSALPEESHSALKKLGLRLRAQRLAQNMTVEQLAERLLCLEAQAPVTAALNPLHLPLQRDAFRLPPRLLREGGAMPLTLRDALPDAWGLRVLAHELGGRLPSEREQLLLTNDDHVGALVFSESREMPPVADLPHEPHDNSMRPSGRNSRPTTGRNQARQVLESIL